MNLSKPVLGTLAVFIFLFTSNISFAQVTSFVAESDAITILNTEKSNAESELSSLVQDTPVLQGQDLQAYATAYAEAEQEYNAAKEALEYKISVSQKMLNELSQASAAPEAVKVAVVSLLERLENAPIDVNSYAFANQALGQDSAAFNNYILDLLGE